MNRIHLCLRLTVLAAMAFAVTEAVAQRPSSQRPATETAAERRTAARDTTARDTVTGTDDESAVTNGSKPYTREVWLHVARQEPSVGDPAFGVTLEGVYLFAPRAHDRWRRNVQAEVLAQPASWLRLEVGYDPASALITGAGGFHTFVEGLLALGARTGAGAYARYDRAAFDEDAGLTDFEIGGQFSFWSDERRAYTNEKVGYRHITDAHGTFVDEGTFLQLHHHLVYVPSEDWGLTFVQDATVQIGIGSDPHTNQLRVENLFLASPSLLYSLGPIVGMNLEYFVGPATSALSVPIGARAEIHPGLVVIAATAVYDVATMSGQRTAGLRLRGSVGMRF